jgi:hypothetical protein
MKGQVSELRLVGSVDERELRLDGNSVIFKRQYRTKFYSSYVMHLLNGPILIPGHLRMTLLLEFAPYTQQGDFHWP